MNSTGGCWGSSYYRSLQLLFLLRVFDTCLSGNRFSRRRHLSPPSLPIPFTPLMLCNRLPVKEKREREREKVELIIRIEPTISEPPYPPIACLSSTPLLLDGAFSFWIPLYTALYLLLYCMHKLCISYLETLVVLSRLFITVFNRNLL
jgi:hypothetical protein